MATRRQFLALGAGAAGLLGLGALRARAEGPPYLVYLPALAGPPPTAEPTVEPTAEPTPGPTVEPTVEPTAEPTAEPTPGPTDEGWIIAAASGGADQAIAWLVARAVGYTAYDITSIVQVYASLGESVGVDWFLALAQCAHETGGLTSWWSQRPRRNPAGLGVTGKLLPGLPDAPPGPDWSWDGAQWREGLSFTSWAEAAIPAHLGRLLAYALPAGMGTPAQQALIDVALSRRGLPAQYRGVAPTIGGLDGRWAYPGVGYGARILDLARRMRAG